MNTEYFFKLTDQLGIDFYTGVPDSLLSPLCDTLFRKYGASGRNHVVAANEGCAVGLAAGHYIATGRPALVYLQNSGIGNAANPIISLLDRQIYQIPCLFVVGWRGEPGVPDEPQHRFQGMITLELLTLLGIRTFVLEKGAGPEDAERIVSQCHELLQQGLCAAIAVKKGAFEPVSPASYPSQGSLRRERALELLLESAGDSDIFVTTTGKTSRELFELRETRKEHHNRDFLTVGSMGHALMIALGIANAKPEKIVWCIDGDGAAMMHLGGLCTAAGLACQNLIHVVIHNGAHESVGGMPITGRQVSFARLAEAAGCHNVFHASGEVELRDALVNLRTAEGMCFLEIETALGSRKDLGRPTLLPKENLKMLRKYLQ